MSHHGPDLMARFSAFVADQIGLRFPPDREADLKRGICSAATEFGFDDPADCMGWLMSAPLTRSQVEVLAGNLTIGETYFFREHRVFQILEQEVLPELVRSPRHRPNRLRLWSAGCCSGEEPFSIAITVQRSLQKLDDWKVTILGSDINPRFLKKASKGVFGEWSFRNAPAWLKATYFEKRENANWEIRPEIRKMVRFFHLNLARDVYPDLVNETNAMDVIFCRNVLIYFAPEQANRVLENLSRCLVEGGWLVLSPSETAHLSVTQLASVHFNGAVLFRKESKRTTLAGSPGLDTRQTAAGSAIPSSEPGSSLPVTSPPVAERGVPTIESSSQTQGPSQQGHQSGSEDRSSPFVASGARDRRAITLQARTMANQGLLAEAIALCDLAIALDKVDPSTHYLRAIVLNEQGNQDQASQAFGRAIYLDSNFVLAHFALGNLARASGAGLAARKHFENARSLAERYPPDAILPESDGITASRFCQIITELLELDSDDLKTSQTLEQ